MQWSPGHAVAGFQIQEELGRGGMGVVYRALHVETGQLYAIKTLALEADAKAQARFQREGLGHARVDAHPHVIRVHAAGVAGGRGYLVLELAGGGDLKARLRGGPLEPRAAAQVALEVGLALQHAHAQGVLHRDLKPANVLFDDEGRAKLVDFGLVRLQGEGTLTKSGSMLGTPAFMSPEQAEGAPGGIGPATDVYGLGALLYVSLSGQPPHRGSNLGETLNKIFNVRPVPPSELTSGVPPALDRICGKALEKSPADRFASVAEMVAALEAFLDETSEAGIQARRQRPFVVSAVLFSLGVFALVAAGAILWKTALAPAPTPTPTATPTPSATPKPRWELAPGERLQIVLELDEVNDKEFHTLSRGTFDLEVVGPEPRGWLLRGTWVLDPELKTENLKNASGGSDMSHFARLTFPPELFERARDRPVLELVLTPYGRVAQVSGLEPLRRELMAAAPVTPADRVSGGRTGAFVIGTLYETKRILGTLDFMLSPYSAGSRWEEKEPGLFRALGKAERQRSVPSWTGESLAASRFSYSGEAEFREGVLVRAKVKQETHTPGRIDIVTKVQLTLRRSRSLPDKER